MLLIIFSHIITVQSKLYSLVFFQHMKRCQMRKRGESMIGLDRALSPAKTWKEETSTSTSPLTLTSRTCSETSISTVKTGTHAPNGTSRSISELTSTATTATRGTSKELSEQGSLRICLTIWRECLHLTDMPSGLRAGFQAWQSSTAGLWLRGGGIWWPPTLTVPHPESHVTAH